MDADPVLGVQIRIMIQPKKTRIRIWPNSGQIRPEPDPDLKYCYSEVERSNKKDGKGCL
jgi:hypothetical protein